MNTKNDNWVVETIPKNVNNKKTLISKIFKFKPLKNKESRNDTLKPVQNNLAAYELRGGD
jgi:hypothetical protein